MGQVDQIADNGRRVGAVSVHFLQFAEQRLHVAAHHLIEQFKSLAAVGHAQHFLNDVNAHFAAAERNRLVEQRQSVAGGTVGSRCNHVQRLVVGFQVFRRNNFVKHFQQVFDRQPLKVKTLTAGQYRNRHFADFGGGEDELDMRRRFFKRFQQSVERAF